MAAKNPKSTQSRGMETSGHVRPKKESHATEELTQAVEKAENIIAETDARSPVTTSPTIRLNEAKFSRSQPRSSQAMVELRYAIHDVVYETSQRLRSWAQSIQQSVTGRPRRSIAIVAGIGFLIGAYRRRMR